MAFLIKNMGRKILRDSLRSLQRGEGQSCVPSSGKPGWPSLPAGHPKDLLEGRGPASHLLSFFLGILRPSHLFSGVVHTSYQALLYRLHCFSTGG